MYVKNLTVKNFRAFQETELTLNYSGGTPRFANVNLFVGGNGAGKSSILKAIPLAILSPIFIAGGFNSEFSVRRGSQDVEYSTKQAMMACEILVDDTDTDTTSVSDSILRSACVILQIEDSEQLVGVQRDEKAWKPLYRNDSPAFFIVGYGANRRTERPEGYSESNRSPRYQRVASLFEDHVGMVPFTYAALRLSVTGYWVEAKDLLNSLLPDEIQLTDRVDSQKRPLFDRLGILLPFPALSDGFRAFVGWVWDMLYQIALVQPSNQSKRSLIEQTGVVIVDEIDLFLHPEWQRCVIEQVATTFPNLQFLFSSHSPLVAGTLEPKNIFVLETDDEGAAVVKQYEENIYGLTANQVLTSSYFGLASTRAPGTGTLSDMAARSLGFETFADSIATANGSDESDSEAISRKREESDRLLAEIAAG